LFVVSCQLLGNDGTCFPTINGQLTKDKLGNLRNP